MLAGVLCLEATFQKGKIQEDFLLLLHPDVRSLHGLGLDTSQCVGEVLHRLYVVLDLCMHFFVANVRVLGNLSES